LATGGIMGNRVAGAVSLAALLLAAAWSADSQPSDPSAAIDADIAATRRRAASGGSPVESPAARAPILQPGGEAPPQLPELPSAVATFHFAPGVAGNRGIGDARLGRTYAIRNCRPCHVVTSGQAASVGANGPNFRSIANRPRPIPFRVDVWLSDQHPTIPNLPLTAAQATNLTAYIMSLRR
jgi:hypothetical protein